MLPAGLISSPPNPLRRKKHREISNKEVRCSPFVKRRRRCPCVCRDAHLYCFLSESCPEERGRRRSSDFRRRQRLGRCFKYKIKKSLSFIYLFPVHTQTINEVLKERKKTERENERKENNDDPANTSRQRRRTANFIQLLNVLSSSASATSLESLIHL